MVSGVKQLRKDEAFTIVELLIVVVVIAILAAITIVAYNGIQQRSTSSAVQSSVQQAIKKIESQKAVDGSYPANLAAININNSSSISYNYVTVESGGRACVSAQSGAIVYSITTASTLMQGDCGQVVSSFYAGTDTSVTPLLVRPDAQIANNWGTGSPGPGVPSDNFSAKFETKITPPVSGSYTFYTLTDDNAQLVVDGQTILPLTSNGARDATATPITLTAGVPVSVVYTMQEFGGNAYATLSWTYPGMTTRTTVPSSVFSRP